MTPSPCSGQATVEMNPSPTVVETICTPPNKRRRTKQKKPLFALNAPADLKQNKVSLQWLWFSSLLETDNIQKAFVPPQVYEDGDDIPTLRMPLGDATQDTILLSQVESGQRPAIEFVDYGDILPLAIRRTDAMDDPFFKDPEPGTNGNITWVKKLNRIPSTPTAEECAQFENKMHGQSMLRWRGCSSVDKDIVAEAAVNCRERISNDMKLAMEVEDFTLAGIHIMRLGKSIPAVLDSRTNIRIQKMRGNSTPSSQ